MTKYSRSELIERIRQAFAEREYPGDTSLVQDRSGDDLEQAEIAAAFAGRHWDQIPPEVLEYHHSALTFFTPLAFCYYLPAFILAYLEHYDELCNAIFYLIEHLTFPGQSRFSTPLNQWPDINLMPMSEQMRKRIMQTIENLQVFIERSGGLDVLDTLEKRRFEEKMAELKPHEKAAVRDFLEYLTDSGEEDAKRALESYWINC